MLEKICGNDALLTGETSRVNPLLVSDKGGSRDWSSDTRQSIPRNFMHVFELFFFFLVKYVFELWPSPISRTSGKLGLRFRTRCFRIVTKKCYDNDDGF